MSRPFRKFKRLLPAASPRVAAKSTSMVVRSGILLISTALLSACGSDSFVSDTGSFVSQTGQSLYTQAADQFATPHQYANDPLLYDGSYQGNTKLVSATGLCPQPRYGVVMIGDNMLTYAYTPQQVFLVPVLPDGTLHGVAGNITLDGKIARDRLNMTISSPTCTSNYTTHFILNHS